MNVTRENIDEVNAVINLVIEKADYEKQVAEVLKDYRKKANIPGFRPGKVPAGIINKRFGTAVLVEEVNKLISQNLSKYLVDEKLSILGEPLPNEDKQKDIDWEKDENFEFHFDIGLAPEINITLDKRSKYKYYTITVSDEMIAQQEEMAASQLGKNVPVEEAKDNSSVRGNMVQLDEEGNEVEDGISAEGALLAVDRIKDTDIQKLFVGCKKDDIVVFNPMKAFDNNHEVGHLLGIKPEEAETLESEFRYTVTEILQFEKAELNEELFKQLYGEDTEVKTIEDFRARIKEEIANNLVYSSEQKFTIDVRDALVEKINPELPDAFLKRWLLATNKELTPEQIDSEFEAFLKDLQWQLIKDQITKDNELSVAPEEAEDFAKKLAFAQFQQYGMHNVTDEQLQPYAQMMLEKPEEKERIYKKLYEDKVVAVVKDKVTLQEEEVSQEEFNKMMG
jgi:trigger factor